MSGNAWDNTIVISKGKLNQMTIISGTSSYLSGLANVVNQVHLPSDTGSGYIAYNLFSWDGSVDRNLSNPVHTHAGISTGGDLTQIYYNNSRIIDTLPLWLTRVKKADWRDQTVDSGCSIADDSATTPDSIKITVGTTINTRAIEAWDGLAVRYDDPIYFETMVLFNTAITSMVWNAGVDPEDVGDSNSTALKAIFEYCSSVNSNYFIATSDGTTRTSSDTGVALDTTNERMLKFMVTPTVKTDWKVFTTVGIKTTNVPDTGNSSDRSSIIKMGQKTTASSAGKSVNHWGARLIYTAGEILQS